MIDEDIEHFQKFFCNPPLNNDNLSGPEKAILKTYLYFKTVTEPLQEKESGD